MSLTIKQSQSDPTLDEMLDELYEMLEPKTGGEEIPRFRFRFYTLRFFKHLFLLTLVGGLVLFLLGTLLGIPEIIKANLSPWSWRLPVNLVIGALTLCFTEFLLHLHPMHIGLRLPQPRGLNWLIGPLNNWLVSIKASHDGCHHKSVYVRFRNGKLEDESAIDTAEKTVSATFPKYILAIFWGIFAVLVIPLQLIFREMPMMLSFALCISFSVWLYENRHAVDHFPGDWWRKQCYRKLIGPIVMRIHALHFIHHLSPKRNLNVGGVWLIPLADLVLGTWLYLRELMEAWLKNDPGTDWKGILERAHPALQRKPWSFKIRSSFRRLFQKAA